MEWLYAVTGLGTLTWSLSTVPIAQYFFNLGVQEIFSVLNPNFIRDLIHDLFFS